MHFKQNDTFLENFCDPVIQKTAVKENGLGVDVFSLVVLGNQCVKMF